ncbi:MAG: 50S ribosomal protein L5 [Candidatus Peregrinibacteria bacterium]
MTRLSDRLKSQIRLALAKELGLKNPMAAPQLRYVRVNVGIGTLLKKTKDFSDVVSNVAKITGQKPVVSKARKAISNFKLRQGMPIGIHVTLRGKRMIDFVERLVNIALPRIRDFRGLSRRSLDGHGNLSVGFREATVFPEISAEDVLNVHGMQVTIVTTAKNDEQGLALLKHIGFPFKKES